MIVCPREEVPREEIPREEIPREEVPREEVPREEVPREEVPGEEAVVLTFLFTAIAFSASDKAFIIWQCFAAVTFYVARPVISSNSLSIT